MVNKLRIPLLLALLWSFLFSVASADEQVYRGVAALGEDELLTAVHVDLSDEEFPSKVMGLVSRAPKLRTLVVAGPRFYDRHFQKLAEIETLRSLVLDCTDVTDEAIEGVRQKRPELIIQRSQRWAIERIRGLALEVAVVTQDRPTQPELRQLLGDQYFKEAVEVDFSRVPDEESGPWDVILNEELAPLRYLTTVRELRIGWLVRLNDSGMCYLKGLTNVEVLSIPTDEVTIDGLASVRSMSGLRVFYGGLSNNELSHFSGLKELEDLNIGNVELTDEGLVHLHGLQNLKRLNLSGAAIEGEGLRHLSELPKLETLCIENSQLQDLVHVPKIESLRQLEIDDTQIDDSTIANLAKAANLEWLTMSNTGIGDAGAAHLNGLTKLRFLDLEGTQIGDKGIAHLNRLPKLRELNLNGTRVGDAGIAHLQQLPELRYLHLKRTKVTNMGLKHLRECSLLQLVIDLPLDEEGIRNLESLTTLRALYLQSAKKGDAAYELALYARLRKALPKCSFNSNEGLYRDD